MNGIPEAISTPGLTGAALLLEVITFSGMVALFGFVLRINQKLNDHERSCAGRWGRLKEKLGIEGDD